jgi:hypothetical protein
MSTSLLTSESAFALRTPSATHGTENIIDRDESIVEFVEFFD